MPLTKFPHWVCILFGHRFLHLRRENVSLGNINAVEQVWSDYDVYYCQRCLEQQKVRRVG